MKLPVLLSLLIVFILSGCTISSPLTTTSNWLEAVKNSDFTQASQYMVTTQLKPLDNVQLQSFKTEYEQKFVKLQEYSIQNAIPLEQNQLLKLEATEGNTVYYTQVTRKRSSDNMAIIVVKINNQWKIIEPDYAGF